MLEELADLVWPEVAAATDRTLLVPLGSCEQHGPHLPMGTDTLIAAGLARAAAARVDAALVAPAIAIAASGEHQGFPGTLSIGTGALVTVLVELVRSADWARRVVLVNGHGGNADAVRRAVAQLASEGRPVTPWWPDLRGLAPDGDLHAGWYETAIVLALAPHLVRSDAAVPGPSPSLGQLQAHGVRDLSPTGVLGDPTGATADDGHRLLAALTEQLVAAVTA